ncbi:hypothetical protein BN2475_440017 [Paraburkholderia ribeironis]|uniref:Uncharacterized protein n=1 Tax=Paraburkholderia ribeironis TaxID=1247936 RepID=A0A1N7S861_9BURK|nr:hypothetical protein BN2475_440017 [Paraburkholderia ribeironis]
MRQPRQSNMQTKDAFERRALLLHLADGLKAVDWFIEHGRAARRCANWLQRMNRSHASHLSHVVLPSPASK